MPKFDVEIEGINELEEIASRVACAALQAEAAAERIEAAAARIEAVLAPHEVSALPPEDSIAVLRKVSAMAARDPELVREKPDR
ncbi:MAG: hypothetical protein KC501_25020 [Myxococcales bacterium]|nr:hypothetical protein [Myxococcales bacterium]